MMCDYYLFLFVILCGPGSSVGIATELRAGRSVIEFRWGRGFPHLSRLALGSTQPPVKWVMDLSRGKVQPGRAADHSPPSSAAVVEEYSYTSTPPSGPHRACNGNTLPLPLSFYLLFYKYSTYVFVMFFLCLFCIFVFYFMYSEFLYCFVYCFSSCAVPFPFLYESTDRCHRVEIHLK